MITPARREILQHLERLSELAPDVRFGQLVAFLPELADESVGSIWDIDDDQLLAAVRRQIADLTARQQSVA
jgi:hypothetical protein